MPLYIIVMPYLRHFAVFVPKIGEIEERNGIYNTREAHYLLSFPRGCIFFEKSFPVLSIMLKIVRRLGSIQHGKLYNK